MVKLPNELGAETFLLVFCSHGLTSFGLPQLRSIINPGHDTSVVLRNSRIPRHYFKSHQATRSPDSCAAKLENQIFLLNFIIAHVLLIYISPSSVVTMDLERQKSTASKKIRRASQVQQDAAALVELGHAQELSRSGSSQPRFDSICVQKCSCLDGTCSIANTRYRQFGPWSMFALC